MRNLIILGALAAVGLTAAGCEDITNPVEEAGEFAPPYVVVTSTAASVLRGQETALIFDAPTRPAEDVIIDYAFGGEAVFGEDFIVTDAAGTPLPGVTSSGGTITIEADPNAEAPEDTIYLAVPVDATVDAQATVEITSASLASGGEVTVGRLGDNTTFTMTIVGLTDIPTGTYTGELTGDLGSGTVSIIVADSPVIIGDTEYRYQMNDFAGGAFGAPIDWAFNVFSDGVVSFAPTSTSYNVTADVTGSYDFDTNTLTFDVVYVQDGSTFTWTHEVTLE